ncbi:MAG: hypothetical protein ABF291_03655 [Desulfobacterales bacterium]
MKNSKLLKAINTMMILATLSAVPACASSNKGGGGGRGGMQGPPPEAIEACEGKAEGDSVTFEGRRGDSVPAKCSMVNDQLVAVPEGHKPQ